MIYIKVWHLYIMECKVLTNQLEKESVAFDATMIGFIL